MEGVVAVILHSVLADVPVREESDQLPQRDEGGGEEEERGSSTSMPRFLLILSLLQRILLEASQ